MYGTRGRSLPDILAILYDTGTGVSFPGGVPDRNQPSQLIDPSYGRRIPPHRLISHFSLGEQRKPW